MLRSFARVKADTFLDARYQYGEEYINYKVTARTQNTGIGQLFCIFCLISLLSKLFLVLEDVTLFKLKDIYNV